MFRQAIAAVALTLIVAASAPCAPPQVQAKPTAPAVLLEGWHPSKQYPGEWTCWRGGRIIAHYAPADASWWIHNAGTNKLQKILNVPEGLPRLPTGAVAANYGVDKAELEKMPSESWIFSGQPITRDDGFDLIGNGVPDDRHKLRVGVIGGSEDQRRRAIQAIETDPALSVLREKGIVHVHADPKHWHLATAAKLDQDERFRAAGFGVYFTGPPVDGRAKHLASCYDAEPASVRAAGVEALRRVDPAYNPNKVPNGKASPASDPAAWLLALLKEHWLAALFGGVALLILLRLMRQAPAAAPVAPMAVQARAPVAPARRVTQLQPAARPVPRQPVPLSHSRPELPRPAGLLDLIRAEIERDKREETELRKRQDARAKAKQEFRRLFAEEPEAKPKE